jgi:L-serine kinase (ATP) / ParB family transcriptional regulator, heme-responsive regulator
MQGNYRRQEMIMIPDLPVLCFLKIEDVIIHEWHDDQRTPPLIDRIRETGLFRNPPIVAPLPDGSGRYMVLDGANRITALRSMGFPDVLVQVVEPDHPGLRLENWNHVLWEMDPKVLLADIRAIPDVNPVVMQDQGQPNIMDDCGLALVQVPRGKKFTLCTGSDELVVKVALLNAIVDCYKNRAKLDRTMARDVRDLEDVYTNLSGLIIFPQFKIRDVLRLAGAGYLLPTGITRFTISPRALHVNYPLYELAADKSLEEKNNDLQRWVQSRINKKGVRYYAEATFLFDE